MRQAGRYLPEYRDLRARAGSFLAMCYDPALAAEVTLQPLRRYGMDAAILFSDILVVPHALGQRLDFVEGEGPRLDPVRRTGDLTRLSRTGFHDHLAPVYEAVGRIAGSLDESTALIGFAGAPWTVATYMVEGGGSKDFTAIKTWAYSDPTGFARLIDLLVDVTAEYLIRQIGAGAEVVQLFDSWAGALPPGPFRTLVIEPTRRIVDQVKAACPGVPIIGFPRAAGLQYQAYVRDTGVDAVGLDTTVPPDWAAEQLQPRLPVQGNLDPIVLVAGGDVLRTAVRDLLETFKGGPWVFNLGHGVVPSTPPEHVAELARLLRC
jgi:uroporphyrinogen decarboxylase